MPRVPVDLLAAFASYCNSLSLIVPGSRIGVAVSGGGDSVALLDLLVRLKGEWRLDLHVVHVNHQLRGAESDADEAFVRNLASDLALPFLVSRNGSGQAPLTASEDWARQERRTALRTWKEEHNLANLCLGHTADDQVETVLFRFLRGSGVSGLAGILPRTADGLLRPLLNFRRGEIRDYLQSRGIGWREDSTNTSLQFRRNRLRLDLIPTLERDWNPELASNLLQLADLAQAEERDWQDRVQILADRLLRPDEEDGLVFSHLELTAMSLAMARRFLREAIRRVRGGLQRIEFHHIERVVAVAAAPQGQARCRIPDVDVFRSFEWVRLSPLPGLPGSARYFEVPVQAPGRFAIPHRRRGIEITSEPYEPLAEETRYNNDSFLLDAGRCADHMVLRSWRPGDRFHPVGSTESVKVKELFQRARIPLWERPFWPMLVSEKGIVWIRRFGAANEVTPSEQTIRCWSVTEW